MRTRARVAFRMAVTIKRQNWYDFALTYGAVQGPFSYDHTMPKVGSMKCTRYKALAIFTHSAADLATSYDFPVIP